MCNLYTVFRSCHIDLETPFDVVVVLKETSYTGIVELDGIFSAQCHFKILVTFPFQLRLVIYESA